ncbi:tRNA uridine-5-carboxymethylaminomethyl(34) synthesis GTPase MnmE [candidate division KSB1 bacterium]|nr:tRNA uridine-5-carboxymethylaminomethyl(34) synthesis GTPase MnmE [candidate division KSB1 bacterium]
MRYQPQDTIAAIATPPGEAGLAVIRISGLKSTEIVAQFFRGRVNLVETQPWRVYLGRFYFSDHTPPAANSGVLYDQVLITRFQAPFSYTAENLVEISCHGGYYIAQKILTTLITHGARLAAPGEFTLRAFLNGRIDLSQAEAVADLIQAHNDLALRNSLQQLAGFFTETIEKFRAQIIETIALLELELDFAEEDVQFANRHQIQQMLTEIETEIQRLIDTFKNEKIVKAGAKVVILGKPNVGKSSLLNVLLKENRAIVTDVPGTTRDILEEQITIEGVTLRLVDTAGISSSDNPVEQEGIRRTRANLEDAEVLLTVFDGSQSLDQNDQSILNYIYQFRDQKIIFILLNKSDLHRVLQCRDFPEIISSARFFYISALKSIGLVEFVQALVTEIQKQTRPLSEHFVITNLRHKIALERALGGVSAARISLEQSLSGEFIVSDLRQALESLEIIIGKITSDEILEHIFSRFCIGK